MMPWTEAATVNRWMVDGTWLTGRQMTRHDWKNCHDISTHICIYIYIYILYIYIYIWLAETNQVGLLDLQSWKVLGTPTIHLLRKLELAALNRLRERQERDPQMIEFLVKFIKSQTKHVGYFFWIAVISGEELPRSPHGISCYPRWLSLTRAARPQFHFSRCLCPWRGNFTRSTGDHVVGMQEWVQRI